MTDLSGEEDTSYAAKPTQPPPVAQPPHLHNKHIAEAVADTSFRGGPPTNKADVAVTVHMIADKVTVVANAVDVAGMTVKLRRSSSSLFFEEGGQIPVNQINFFQCKREKMTE
jgi:hypothetical protein